MCFPLSRRRTFAENKPIRMSNKTIPNWRIIGVFVLFTLFYKSLHLFLLSPRTSSERKFKWTRELSLATITKFTRQSNENFACLVGIDRQVFPTPFVICLSVGFQTTTWKTSIFWLYIEHHVNLIYLVGLDILLIVFCFPFVGFRREKGLWSC